MLHCSGILSRRSVLAAFHVARVRRWILQRIAALMSPMEACLLLRQQGFQLRRMVAVWDTIVRQ